MYFVFCLCSLNHLTVIKFAITSLGDFNEFLSSTVVGLNFPLEQKRYDLMGGILEKSY